jgi:hypothetical protein
MAAGLDRMPVFQTVYSDSRSLGIDYTVMVQRTDQFADTAASAGFGINFSQVIVHMSYIDC